MRVLLCAIVALPLVLFGIENADNTNTANQKTLDLKDSKSDKGDFKDKKDSKDSSESHESAKDSAQDSTQDSTKSPKSAQDSHKSSAESSAESPKDSLDSQSITKTTKEESGWMLGVGFLMGGSIGEANSPLSAYLSNGSKPFYYGAEVLLGHKTFFGDGLFGMRLYIDYNYRKSRGLEMTSHILGLNIDTLWNFTQGEVFKIGMLLGVRSGIGFGRFNGCIVYDGEEYCGGNLDIEWSADLNIGARFVIYDHNAFELLLQPRFGLWVLSGKNSMYGIVRYVYTF